MRFVAFYDGPQSKVFAAKCEPMGKARQDAEHAAVARAKEAEQSLLERAAKQEAEMLAASGAGGVSLKETFAAIESIKNDDPALFQTAFSHRAP